MAKKFSKKIDLRIKRKMRIRKKVVGSVSRPRLSVFRSARHLTAQVIDDTSGKTLVSIHSFESTKRAGKEQCTQLGKDLAGRCIAAKIDAVVFDKNGYEYHGRVKAFADGAREAGLKF